ncbi:sulfur oxidation c-type cytochrome SoxX [Pseudoduganella danionis]|uniref:sulfur oxidation c-type cytochrome SoxX n=1 Tax=Pseudoduganella danionis TaxID=1890295 RepID=UPI0035B2F817
MSNPSILSKAGVLLALSTGLTCLPASADDLANFKASFAEKGIAKLDRLEQSELQKICSTYATKPLPAKVRAKLEKAEMAAVKHPADGNYLGDWREGEKIAQNGRGLQFSDDAKTVNGGNCYACHQITKSEIAYGNIGPSLAEYGKLRGGPTEAIVRYTWSKLYSSHAVNACSVMPRYGAAGILSEQQMKDVMALLLDPQSPVNQ